MIPPNKPRPFRSPAWAAYLLAVGLLAGCSLLAPSVFVLAGILLGLFPFARLSGDAFDFIWAGGMGLLYIGLFSAGFWKNRPGCSWAGLGLLVLSLVAFRMRLAWTDHYSPAISRVM